MPLNREMVKRTVRRTRKQKQRGGSYTGGYGNYAFTGPAGVSAGGVPFESRAAFNGNCGWDLRTAPHVSPVGAFHGQKGGKRSRKNKKQRGGSCGCGSLQRGGGGGTGGYSFDFGNNALGKVYAALPTGPCPATPVATPLGTTPLYKMAGGDASYRDLAAIDSYKTGYEFGPRGVVSTNSAHYLDPIGYDRTCRGGARRTKKGRKNRKH